jgi:hypothetical protein
MKIVKRCSCGRAFSLAQFRALERASGGLFSREVYDDVSPPEVVVLEFRNCTCGSTIAISIEEHEMTAPPIQAR